MMKVFFSMVAMAVLCVGCGAEPGADEAQQAQVGDLCPTDCTHGTTTYLSACVCIGTPVTDHRVSPPTRCVVTDAQGFGACLPIGTVIDDHRTGVTCTVQSNGTCQ